jgi:dipeptidyl aminopeptidase/acylaminoacyl peptidase
MRIPTLLGLALITTACALRAQVPDNLVAEGIPAFPETLKTEAGRYLEFRAASVADWHPQRREMLITTRFADTPQLHVVRQPGGARRQMTFFPDRVGGGLWQPGEGKYFVFSKDTGGNEFFQYYRYDAADGRVTLLTDGKSRNTGAVWSKSGRWLAFTSTHRNGKDNDLWLVDPADPGTARLLLQVEGGGWAPLDWSPDESTLVVGEYLSINESHLHLVNVNTGAREAITTKGATPVAYAGATFTRDGRALLVTSDQNAEFQRLGRLDLSTKAFTPLTGHIAWDVSEFDLSPDGRTVAFITNEDGVGVLHLLDVASGREKKAPRLPVGVPSGLRWHSNGRDLAFSFTSATAPADAFSVNVKTGKMDRWTESETGGLDTSGFVTPDLVRIRSFDGLFISGFLYRPNTAKFPGKRPVIISIHGGPESQSRPIFQARNNYLLNDLGIALFFPNVRGSAGYGKTFLALDNGFKREDSVKDIGVFIEWLRTQPGLDGDRLCVYGGSYGGYMVLASLTHFSSQLRCGIDVVGISHFLTFLKNTESYRRDLRRVEYGDERDAAMAAHLEKISPLTNVKKIGKPLFVIQGKNDPRVPYTEAEQMVKAIRENNGTAWYLMAKDEGHGFAKKKNADFQFLAMVLFLQQHLVN